MKSPKFIFLNGEYVNYEDAKIHVLTTANKFAAIVYEGIRAYWNSEKEELFIFRYKEHIDRLLQSMKITRMRNPYTHDEYKNFLVNLLKKNELREDVHIRHQSLVLTDNGALSSTGPIGVMIAAMPLGRYYEGEKKGINVCISSWRRISEDDLSPRIKSTANYANSRLALIQAREDGYDDAIILTTNGNVAEGTGSNLFMIKNGQPITPMTTNSILEGITRSSLITLFKQEHGIEVIERNIDRTELYTADEAFFCGSGVEITPILSIDRYELSGGNIGPLTQKIGDTYFRVVRGEISKYKEWLTSTYGI